MAALGLRRPGLVVALTLGLLAWTLDGFMAPLPAYDARWRVAPASRRVMMSAPGSDSESTLQARRWLWQRWTLRLRRDGSVTPSPEEQEASFALSTAQGRPMKQKVKDFMTASGIVVAAVFRNAPPWDKGLGVNPTPATFLQIYGPYIFTILFLTFGLRGLEPLRRFLYDRSKRRKQESRMAKPKKNKAKYYRTPSRLYDLAKSKLEAASEATKEAEVAEAEGENEEAVEEEVKEEEPKLSAFRCEVCSFTLYPAKGREFKFFSDTFKCPSCGAKKDKFYDLTDEDDSRNQEQPAEQSDDTVTEDDLGDADSLTLGDDDADAPAPSSGAETASAPEPEGRSEEAAPGPERPPVSSDDHVASGVRLVEKPEGGATPLSSALLEDARAVIDAVDSRRVTGDVGSQLYEQPSDDMEGTQARLSSAGVQSVKAVEDETSGGDGAAARRIVLGDGGATPRSNGTSSGGRAVMPVFALNLSAGGSDGGREHAEQDARSSALMADAIMGVATAAALAAPRARTEERAEGRALEADSGESGSQLDTRGWRTNDRNTQLETRVKKQGLSFTIKIDVQVDDDEDDQRLDDQERQQQPARALWLGQARPMPAPSAVDVVTKDDGNSADEVDTVLTSVAHAVEPRNVTRVNDLVTYIDSPLAKDEGFGEEVERRLPEGTVNVSWLGSLPSFAQLFADEYIPTEKEIAQAKAKMEAEAKLREMGGVPESDVVNVRGAAHEEYVDEAVEEVPQEQWDESVQAPLDDASSELCAEPAVVDEWASEPLPEFERQADDNEGGFRRVGGGDVEYEPEPQDALMAEGALEPREGESEYADDVARRPASAQDVQEVAKEVAEESAEGVAAALSDALDTITSDDVKESGRADDVEASSSAQPSKDVILDAPAKPEEEKLDSADMKAGEAAASSEAAKDDEDSPPTTPLNMGAVIDIAESAPVDDVEMSRMEEAAADPLGEASEQASHDDAEAPGVDASAHEFDEQSDEVAVSAEAADDDSEEQANSMIVESTEVTGPPVVVKDDADTAPEAGVEFTARLDADESAPADDVEAAPQRGAEDLLSADAQEEEKEERAETPVAEPTAEAEEEQQKDDAPALSESTDAPMVEERVVDEDKPAETADVMDEENEAVSSDAFKTAEADEIASPDDVELASDAESSGYLVRDAEASEENDEGRETLPSQTSVAASDGLELGSAQGAATGQELVTESVDDTVAAEPEPLAEEAAVPPEEPANVKKHLASLSDPASDDWVHPYASEGTVADDDVENVDDTPKLTSLSRFRHDDPLHRSRAPADVGIADDASAHAAPALQTTSNADREIEGPEASSRDDVARVSAEAEQTETPAPAEEKAEADVAEQPLAKDEIVAPPNNFFRSRWHEPERRRRGSVEPEPVTEDAQEAAPKPVKEEQLLFHGDASRVEESIAEEQPEGLVDEHKPGAKAGDAMPRRSRWHDDDDDRRSARPASRVREMEPVEDELESVADESDAAQPHDSFTTTADIERDETVSADDVEASLHAESSSDLLLEASQDGDEQGAESMVAESAEESTEAAAESEHTDERDDTTDEHVVMPEPTAADEDAQEQRSTDDVAVGELEQPHRSRWRDDDDGRRSARRAESRDVVDEQESVRDEIGAPSAPAVFKTTAPVERDETVSADNVEASLPAESSADVLLGGTETAEGDEGSDSLLAHTVDDDAADFKPVDAEHTDAEPSTDASSAIFKTSFSSDEAVEPAARDDVAGDGPLQSSSESERGEHEGSMHPLSHSEVEEPERSSGDEETETAAEAEQSSTDDAELEQGLGVVSRDDVTPEPNVDEATAQHSGRSSRWRDDDDRRRSRAAADHAEAATIGDTHGASRPSESKGEDADAPAEQELDGQAFETTSLSADDDEKPSPDDVQASSAAAADDNNGDFIKLDASAVTESEEPRRSRWRDMDERPSARLSKDALEIFRVVDRLERETDRPLRATWLGPVGRRAEAFVQEADEAAEPTLPHSYVEDSSGGLLDAEPAAESTALEPVAEQEEKETVHDGESKGDMLDTDAQELPKEPQPVFYALDGAENELLKDEVDPSLVSKSLSRWREGDERPKNPVADVLLAEDAHDAEAAIEQSSADEVEAPAAADAAQAQTSVHEEAELSADVVAASPGEARYDLLFEQPALPAAEEGVDDFLLAAPGAHDEVDSVEPEPVLADEKGESVGDAEPADEETVSEDSETPSATTSGPSESLELRQEEDRVEEEAARPLADDVARVPFFGKVVSRSAGQGLLAEEGDEGEMSPHDDDSPSADLAAEPATDGADHAPEDAEEASVVEPEGAIEDEVADVAESHDDVHDFGSSTSLLLHDDSRDEEVAEARGAPEADDADNDKVDVVMAAPIESPAYDTPARETFGDEVEMPQVSVGDAFGSRLPISRMEDAAAREEPFVSAASSDGFFGSQPDSDDVLPSIRAMGRPDDLIPASRSVEVPTIEAAEYEMTGGEGSIIRDNAELAAAEESGGELASEVSVLEPEETKKDDVVADNVAAAANEKTVSGDELFNALFAHKDEVAEGLSAFSAEGDGADVLELKRADYGMEDVSEAPVADDAARAPWFGTVSNDRGLNYGDLDSNTENSILDVGHEHVHEPEQNDEAVKIPVQASADGEEHVEEEGADVVVEKDEEVQAAPEPSSLLEMGTSVPLPPTELLREAPQRPVESRRVAWMGRAWRKSTRVFEVAQNRATLDVEGVRDDVAPLPFAEPERPAEFVGSGSLPWANEPVAGSAAPASKAVKDEHRRAMEEDEHDDVFGEHHDVLEVMGTRIKDHGDEPHGDQPMPLHKTQRSPGGRQAWFEDDYNKEKGEMVRGGRSVDDADDKNPIALRDDGKTDKQRALEEAKKGGKTKGFVSMELVVNGDMCVTATVRCDPLNMTTPSSE